MNQTTELRRLLVDGVQALMAGDRPRAQQLLMQYVEQDEKNPDAWLWLSGAVTELEDIEIALQNCLACDPENPRAKQGLQWVLQQRSSN
jgi:thioredoxin-like negative regulator of GroEL